MKKGFTILELLVASLLLGMLVTILTMIFNQSSIAWRTGVAGVADLKDVRENIAALREEADTAYITETEVNRVLSIWTENGELRKRAISTGEYSDERPQYLASKLSQTMSPNQVSGVSISVGSGANNASVKSYIINVKSAGPNGVFGDWDDIWSYPDDFE